MLGVLVRGYVVQICGIAFGLSSAPYVFTKMMRPLVRLWHSKGLKAVAYLDDGVCALKKRLC